MRRALVIDGNNYLRRAFYAVKQLASDDGRPTNAVRGFFSMLSADIKILGPEYLVVAFDKTRSARRLEMFPEYKANRDDDEHRASVQEQLKITRTLLLAAGIRTVWKTGEEADDIIATFSTRFADQGARVLISSTDKDFAQLVDRDIQLVEASTRKVIGRKGVKRK